MRNEDFIVIQGWMLDLDLTDKQLKLYAIIWGYSRDGRSRMRASSAHIAEWLKCTERTAQRILRSLEDMGLVAHEVVATAKGRISEFWAIPPETADPAPSGAKTKIRWSGKGQKGAGKRAGKIDKRERGDYDTDVVTHHDTDVVTHHDTDVVTPKGSNNILPVSHTTTNNNNSREDARSAACGKNENDWVPPTVEEVTAYAKEQGFADPAGFADYYVRYQTEAGWQTGKGKERHRISNWKLNVIQWSQYRKNQVFSQPERASRPARAAEPRRKRVVPVTPEELEAMLF